MSSGQTKTNRAISSQFRNINTIMKLVMQSKNGNVYETELPRRKNKHRVPQKGATVTHRYGESEFTGTVTAVHYDYDQPQGSGHISKTNITVVIEEL